MLKDIKHDHNTIAVKKGNLGAKNASQKQDYISVIYDGNGHIGSNGNIFHTKNDEIWMKCSQTGKDTLYLSKEQMKASGIKDHRFLPEVHVPAAKLPEIIEIIKILGKKK